VLQWLLWIGFEYVRTLRFLDYPYGITAYTQWQFIPLIQVADIFGIWGVSALVIFPSIYFASFFNSNETNKITIKEFFVREKIAGIVWLVALTSALTYGFVSQVDYSSQTKKNIALIQHNTDPWFGGLIEYRRNFEVLARLSDESLTQNPKPDLVVWSETAFVPRIYWHLNYRGDFDSYNLVRDLMIYLAKQDVPFVIGNDDARREPSINPNSHEEYRVDYNAAMLFERGEIIETYRKQHLVPFTESFPYRKEFPFIYEFLTGRDDIHLWERGTEATVFERKGMKFSTPICFEDSFGYISREFVKNGVELIVNLTNDAWSNSLAAQMQHFNMAVFRAVENRRAMVRSTASGQTCGIDPNGRIIAMAEPFKEIYLTVEVPIINNISSVYTKYGDFFPVICILILGVLFLFGIFTNLLKKIKKGRGGA
jgi:apolipoprotein N-acyltransferase